jgi:uncharacterized membrane protein YcaP (DUF421 family)
MDEFYNTTLGIHGDELTWWQMSIRAVIVFIVALIIIRLGNNRIFGKSTAFDIVLGIIYGSVLSRAITGNSPFFPTLVAAFVLVILHTILAVVAFHSNFGFGNFVKGKPNVLIKNGELQWDALKWNSITKNDLEEAVRKSGCEPDLSKIKTAYLERSGDISVIQKEG